MTQSTTRPIVSGRAYPVIQGAAGEPARLEDFVGETRLVLDLDGEPYPVCGCGRQVGDEVRFYQKDHEGTGRDIRRWAIRATADGRILAEHVMG